MKLEIEQKETKNEYKNFKKDFKKIWEILKKYKNDKLSISDDNILGKYKKTLKNRFEVNNSSKKFYSIIFEQKILQYFHYI